METNVTVAHIEPKITYFPPTNQSVNMYFKHSTLLQPYGHYKQAKCHKCKCEYNYMVNTHKQIHT